MLEVKGKRLDREDIVEGSFQKTLGSHTWSGLVVSHLLGPVAVWLIAGYYRRPLEPANTPIDLCGSLVNYCYCRVLEQEITHLFNKDIFNDDRGHIHSQSRVDGNLCRRNSYKRYGERTHQLTEKIYPPHPSVHF